MNSIGNPSTMASHRPHCVLSTNRLRSFFMPVPAVFFTPPNSIQRNFAAPLILPMKAVGPSNATAAPPADVKQLVDFLYEDLPHLFDEQGINRSAYDDKVEFRDPITKHDSISGYLFNIFLLKILFRPAFHLHWAKQTGPYEITTRWTMLMTFLLLPWKPQLIFTGTSVMGINPNTMKFRSHLDYWDSLKNNKYFSFEGLLDLIKQLRYFKTPDIETPRYTVLKRTANYEIRKYDPYIVVETTGDKLSGSSGFRDVAGYIFGKNSTMEKIAMTTPVFTESSGAEYAIKIVLPAEKKMESLPTPDLEKNKLKSVEGGFVGVVKFSGKATEEVVKEKEGQLRKWIIADGLRPLDGCQLARYNDPGSTWPILLRNEVLIKIETFSLDE